jgi:CheY-like chemotaxis protein
MTGCGKILAVDDEAMNLNLMEVQLARAAHRIVRAEDGLCALRKLEEHPDTDAIVLDRKMPNLSGVGFLQRIKADARFKDTPVVMLTGAANEDEAAQSIRSGVRYFLRKPYEGAMLVEIVNLALDDAQTHKTLKEHLRHLGQSMKLLQEGCFLFRTQAEATNLACAIAVCFPEPESAALGLRELMLNAIEHGNLGIGYREKGRLLREGGWKDEVERRLGLPENRNKFASLTFKVSDDAIVVHIEDRGEGFDWRQYLEFTYDRVGNLNGRGIASAREVSFPGLEYLGPGNVARCVLRLACEAER